MFSNRMAVDLRPNQLALAVAARRRAGHPILDLTESNPTRAGFEYPDDLLAPLASPRGLRYAPEPFGLIEARRAVAADYARRGIAADPERIVLTASTSEAYSLLFKLLASPGDEVLVPRPSYPLFELLTTLDGVAARPYDLEYHGIWSIDLAGLERAVGPRTRALLIVNPNNPTGSFASPIEIDRLAAICGRRGIALIVDEVFADYPLEPGRAVDRAPVLTRQDVLAFGLGGLSKSIGLPQLKLGWIAATGPATLVSEAMGRLELMCDTYLSVSTPVQVAAAELLDRGSAIRAQIAARVAANYGRLRALSAAAPSSSVLTASAGWYAVVRVPTLQSEEQLVIDLVTSAGVLVHPGYFFDFPDESYLIVSLLPPEALFAAGVERMLARAEQRADD
ncbi:MAG: pyridoxal phosphate-dependent aminotransferase [Acidobacteriota bacterium]